MKTIRTFSLFIFTFYFSLAASAITATKAYVDGATNATLVAAKAYADTIGGVTPSAVTNIVTNVVTKAYVEGLGISGGGVSTNAVSVIITNHVTSGYLCTVAAANEKYLQLSGGDVNGEVNFEDNIYVDGDSSTFKELVTISGSSGSGLCIDDGSRRDFNYRCGYVSDSSETYKLSFPYDKSGDHTIAVLEDIPDAYTKADADAKYLPLTGHKRMTGPIEMVGGDVGELLTIDGMHFMLDKSEFYFGYGSGTVLTVSSHLRPDDSPVATSNMVNKIVPQFINHTNQLFSNEVLAVGLGIGTNEVAQINAILAETGGGEVGTATTVGGLLAALSLAVAWLKKNLRYANGGAASATMADRTTNVYTLNAAGATVTLAFPDAVEGRMRDFLLDLTYKAGTLAMPESVTKVGDELTFTAGKEYLIAFTEIAANRFYVRSIEIA